MRRAVGPAATLLALLFLAGQLGGFVHLATVRHARCAEHGELIELRDGADNTEHRTSQPALAAGDAAHGHDHCAAADQPRTTVTAPLVTITVAPLDLPAAPPLPEAAPARVPLLLVAPKTSPPARA